MLLAAYLEMFHGKILQNICCVVVIVCENSENYDEAELKLIQYRVRGADFERVWIGLNDWRKISFYND